MRAEVLTAVTPSIVVWFKHRVLSLVISEDSLDSIVEVKKYNALNIGHWKK
jgi:hypothetical protein